MKNLSKLVIFLFFFFVTSFFAINYFLSPILAEDPNPIPQPRVPCYDEEDPEFNSLRPYQASPCGKAPQSYFCGNKIIINESKTRTKKSSEESIACPDILELEEPWKNVDPGTTDNPKDYFIDMSEIELPILGNTQEVQNSQRANDVFNDAQKMNEYVSWYLNGVINRAEYGEGKNTASELVNFSGPINKLMPSMILEAQRIESIKNATAEYGKPVGSPSPEDNEGPSNHNQIVVCSESNIPIIGNLLNLGKFKPVECYKGDGSSAKGFLGLDKEVSRLADWEGDLSVWNSVTNAIIDAISRVVINVSRDVIAQSIGDHWNKRIPPLPWSNMEGKPFESDILYRKAYNEWKGKTCVLIPGIEWLICFENIFVPNRYSDLYQYIPLGNTADRQYKMPISTITIQGVGGTQIDYKKWWLFEDPPGEPLLYYPHSYEARELSEFLNKTFIPSGTPSGEVDSRLSEINGYNRSDPEQCRTIDVRTNEGDNLFPITKREGKDADIAVEVYFEVTKLPRVSCVRTTDEMTGEDEYKGTFHGEVNIEIQTNPIQVPNADQIWQNTVSGAQSTVKRIFPKIEKGSPIECLADIPGESKAVYIPTKGTDKIGVSSMGLNAESYDPLDAELHFPHLGSVYEYFLKGIQTALRPKGYGDPIPNGLYCEEGSTIACGELPELPKATGSCSLGGISSRIGSIPQSLKDIVEAAADTYKTPPNLILAAMYGEGAFNSEKGNSTGKGYEWTDENVKNWATCEPIPNCSGFDSSVVGLSSQSVWDEIAENIKDDIKKLDPNRPDPDPCNLLDMIYGISWTMSRNATGTSGFAGHSCFGIPLNAGHSISTAGTCSWAPEDYETSIRWWEFGTEFTPEYMCATLKNSCSLGGMGTGTSAVNCPTGDDCETINFRYPGEESHNGCLWDVGHGN